MTRACDGAFVYIMMGKLPLAVSIKLANVLRVHVFSIKHDGIFGTDVEL